MNSLLSWLKQPSSLALLYCLLCILLGSLYVAHGSIYFNADISRDFLLLDEIATKGIILIGPRASGLPGLFHGPLWLYLNFPAYLIGQASPVAVGWFWVVLTILTLLGSYFSFRRVSSQRSALIFCCMLAGMLIPWMYQYLNPFGALALMPALVWAILSYQRTEKLVYWALVLLILGAIIQFQMAVGVPLTFLTFVWIGRFLIQKKLFSHLIVLPLLALPLLSFLLFDLRHEFSQTKTVLSYITEGSNAPRISWSDRIDQRIGLATEGGINVFTFGWLSQLNVFVFAFLLMYFLKKLFPLGKKEREVMNLLLYLYTGFYITSLLFNGQLLVHYWWPLVPLSYGMVAILLANGPKRPATLFLLLILGAHLIAGFQFALSIPLKVGLTEDDWKFQTKIAEKIFSDSEEEFGYFIFTPDIYAYESKAAMNYLAQKHPEKHVARYQKRPTTYLIIAPDPHHRPDILSSDWKKQKVQLEATPSATFTFPEGYKVEKYLLTPEQVEEPTDPNIDDWLHFR